jgi:hypothetical protein
VDGKTSQLGVAYYKLDAWFKYTLVRVVTNKFTNDKDFICSKKKDKDFKLGL